MSTARQLLCISIGLLVCPAFGSVPSCSPSPCLNGAACRTKLDGTRYCDCTAWFTGELCQFENPCMRQPCAHGATCQPSLHNNNNLSFVCQCPLGYTGYLCERQVGSACDSSPCLNHGTCQLTTSLTNFQCVCPFGYRGDLCEQRNLCDASPCQNGGRCSSNAYDYSCECPVGFTGRNCQHDIDECQHRPCHNGAKCTNLHGDYKCHCSSEYAGKNCSQLFIPCQPSPCVNNAECLPLGQRAYHCECKPGYTGRHCDVNIDDCVGHRCMNGGRCVDGLNTYTCNCSSGFVGDFCEQDVDECSKHSGVCKNGGTCKNSRGGYECICVNGWEGKHCEYNKDDCEPQRCLNGGTCHDEVARYRCECAPGFIGVLCHLHDPCVSSPCQSGAKCSANPVHGTYTCECPRGYRGDDCSADIDECAEADTAGTSLCANSGNCVNVPGSYRCECSAGWTGEWCDVNINECASFPCLNDATCLDDVGKFTCICMPGYTGTRCESDVDECAQLGFNPCDNGGTCVDRVNDYVCACVDGYSGKNCSHNVDDCLPNTCLNGGTCNDGLNSFTCDCPHDFSGSRCEQYTSECASNPCQHGGLCHAVPGGGYTCECVPGYEGANCEHNIDDCAAQPCNNGGTCVDAVDGYVCYCKSPYAGAQCNYTANPCGRHQCSADSVCRPTFDYASYTCECKPGYTGQFCRRDVDECRRNPCQHAGQCVNTPGAYHCQCPKGYTGLNCETDIDECASDPCANNARCVDLVNGFRCICDAGFEGDLCHENRNECASAPCSNGGHCIDQYAGYVCSCRHGFSGTNCQVNDDDCSDGLCLNGGSCIDGINSYKCECPRGYSGKNCQIQLDLDAMNRTEQLEAHLCARDNCAARAGNGHCDAECNLFACNYDGGDCSAKTPNPFANCSQPAYCARVYGDGTCDSVCNNENCLFDGFDCSHAVPQCDESVRSQCVQSFGDGVCQAACNNAGCSYDGGDCGQPLQLGGDVILIMRVAPEIFVRDFNEFLMTISQMLHVTVHLKHDADGLPMAFRWRSDAERPYNPDERIVFDTDDELRHMFKRSLTQQHVEHGVLVVLTVDVAECQKTRADCFTDVISVAAYLGAAAAKQEFEAALGWPLYQALGERHTVDAVTQDWSVMYIVVGVCVLLVLIASVAYVLRKRKINAPLWHIPPADYKGTPTEYQEWSKHRQLEPPSKRTCFYNNQLNSSANYDSDFPGTLSRHPSTNSTSAGEHYIDYPGAHHQYDTLKRDTTVGWQDAHRMAVTVAGDTLQLDSCTANAVGPDAVTPLHAAVQADAAAHTFDSLIKAGADVNAKTQAREEPAIIMAARLGRVNAAQAMLQAGANVNEVDSEGNTALHHAIAANNAQLVQLLYEWPGTEHEQKNGDGLTALNYAARHDVADCIVRLLLHNGANAVNMADTEGRTPLHWSAVNDNTLAMRLLLDAGANKDAQDMMEHTPLFLAAKQGNVEAAKLLLAAGASKDTLDQMDRSPLQIAQEQQHKAMERLLSGFGAAGSLSLQQSVMLSATAHNNHLPGSAKPKKSRAKKEPQKPGGAQARKQQQQSAAAAAAASSSAQVAAVPSTSAAVFNSHTNSHMVVSPDSSEHSSGSPTYMMSAHASTPSPGHLGYVPQSEQLAKGTSCMLSPYSGSHAGSSVGGQSPQMCVAGSTAATTSTGQSPVNGGGLQQYDTAPVYGESPPHACLARQDHAHMLYQHNAAVMYSAQQQQQQQYWPSHANDDIWHNQYAQS